MAKDMDSVKRYRIKTTKYPSGALESCSLMHLNDAGIEEKHGLSVHWYENGSIGEIAEYKNGVRNGLFSLWFQSGPPISIGQMLDGILVDTFLEFDQSGTCIRAATFADTKWPLGNEGVEKGPVPPENIVGHKRARKSKVRRSRK